MEDNYLRKISIVENYQLYLVLFPTEEQCIEQTNLRNL